MTVVLSKNHKTEADQAIENQVERHKIVQESRQNQDKNPKQDRQQGSDVYDHSCLPGLPEKSGVTDPLARFARVFPSRRGRVTSLLRDLFSPFVRGRRRRRRRGGRSQIL